MSDILYSKLRLEVPQELDGEDAIITSSKGAVRTVEMSSPITDVMLAGMEKYTVQAGASVDDVSVGYGEIKKLRPLYFPNSLENASWANIADVIKAGKFSRFASVGSTKTFKIGAYTYTAEVVSINDGTGDASQWYPTNTVDFICKELYQYGRYYNSSSSNSGGFPSSYIKTYLSNTIYPLLPSDLKAVIINKSHVYQSGSMVNSLWNSNLSTLSTKLWLPTMYEITGNTSDYAPGENSLYNKKYTLSYTGKKKNNDSSSYTEWWLSSPYTYSNSTVWVVRTDGSTAWRAADNTDSNKSGVAICFRIG